jgi:hypothetical protein
MKEDVVIPLSKCGDKKFQKLTGAEGWWILVFQLNVMSDGEIEAKSTPFHRCAGSATAA